MALLEDLEKEHAIIDSAFRRFCASRGLSSVEDFLMQDMYELVAFAEQEADSERLKEGITQVLSIMDEMHKPWLNGLELLKDFQDHKHFLSTGFGGIDFLLQGGFRQGQLTELVGPSSSGKTQICLQSAAEVARRNVGTVIYVDTSNSFSPKRISNLLNQSCTLSSAESRYQMLQNVMRNILCQSVFDIFSMFDVLQQLLYQVERGDVRIPLLIVDSMSSLVTPVLGGSGFQGHSLMVSAGFLLKKLAHEQNVAILVTNHTVGGEGGAPKPALGESWKSVPHVRLLLSRESGSQSCDIRVLKHPSLKEPDWSMLAGNQKPQLSNMILPITITAHGCMIQMAIAAETCTYARSPAPKAHMEFVKSFAFLLSLSALSRIDRCFLKF